MRHFSACICLQANVGYFFVCVDVHSLNCDIVLVEKTHRCISWGIPFERIHGDKNSQTCTRSSYPCTYLEKRKIWSQRRLHIVRSLRVSKANDFIFLLCSLSYQSLSPTDRSLIPWAVCCSFPPPSSLFFAPPSSCRTNRHCIPFLSAP